MPNSIGRELEWCDYMGSDCACYCEVERTSDSDWSEAGPETKCPDLGDWSELPPEDVLDRWESSIYWLSIYACEIAEKRLIELDRERLLAYTVD
jgi:hypothetical protein